MSTNQPDNQKLIHRSESNSLSNNSNNSSNNGSSSSNNLSTDSISISSQWFAKIQRCWSPIIESIKQYKNKNLNQESNWVVSYDQLRNLEYIESGSQGFVYKGQFNGHEIAVKKLKNKEETEIKYLKSIKHHNIVRFFGITTDPFYCVLMEYCPNGTLANLLQNKKFTIESDLIWEFAFQIASGMNYLHHHQIVHRDLKTANILVADENLLKICDFGASKQIYSNDNNDMSFVGTFPYMSPEIVKKVEDFKCSEKIDIWSYGIVFWELMTCEKPYFDINNYKTLFSIALTHINLPIVSQCPDEVSLLIEMCWNVVPENRPTFNEILLHLQLFSKEALQKMTVNDLNQMKYKWISKIDETYAFINSIDLEKTNIPNQYDNIEFLLHKQQREMRTIKNLIKMYEDKLDYSCELYYTAQRVFNCLKRREIELSKK